MEENENTLINQKKETSLFSGFFGGALLVGLVGGVLFQSYSYGLLDVFGFDDNKSTVPNQVLLSGDYFIPKCDRPTVNYLECENTPIMIIEDDFMRLRERIPGERNVDANYIPTKNALVDEELIAFLDAHLEALNAKELAGIRGNEKRVSYIDYELVMLAKPMFGENGAGTMVFTGYQNYETGAFKVIDYKIKFNTEGVVGSLPDVPK